MPAGIKVTEVLFDQIKSELDYVDPTTVAIKNHMSVKTILQVKGAETYQDYTAMKNAQHPPTKFSIRNMLIEINKKLDALIMASGENRLL